MRYEMKCHCAGTKAEYWVLKIFREGADNPEVHSSKDLSYLENIRREYQTGIRVSRESHTNGSI